MRLSISVVGAASVAIVLTPARVWAQAQEPAPYAYDCGPHMMWWGGGWYGMIFGPLFMILVLAIVVAAVVLLVRWIGGPWQVAAPHQAPHARTALDILDERFARGEIQKEEYEEKRRMISA